MRNLLPALALLAIIAVPGAASAQTETCQWRDANTLRCGVTAQPSSGPGKGSLTLRLQTMRAPFDTRVNFQLWKSACGENGNLMSAERQVQTGAPVIIVPEVETIAGRRTCFEVFVTRCHSGPCREVLDALSSTLSFSPR